MRLSRSASPISKSFRGCREVRGVDTKAVKRPVGWRLWLLAARPATLLAAFVPVLVGTALAAADQAARYDVALAALLGAVAIQIGTNFFNDYADFKSGADTAARLGPTRVTQRGWVTPKQVVGASIGAFAAATACGVYLLWAAGWPVVAIGLLSIAAGVAYTGGPYPLGYRGLGDVFVFVFFGLVAVCATYYLQALRLSSACVGAAAAIGALSTAIIVVNNLRDRHTDAPAGKRTLAVRFGAAFARSEYAALLALAYVLPCAIWWLGWGGAGWLLPLASLPLAWRATRAIRRLDGAALNPWLGRTARLEAVFGVLLAIGVLL